MTSTATAATVTAATTATTAAPLSYGAARRRLAGLGLAVACLMGLPACAVGAAAPPAAPLTSAPPTEPAPATPTEPTTEPADPTAAPQDIPHAAPDGAAIPADARIDLQALALHETQNGTAAFGLPAGWRVEDASSVARNHGGDEQWVNQLALIDEAGAERASYRDGYMSDVGPGGTAWTVVLEHPIARSPAGTALAARAWWTELDGGSIRFSAAVTGPARADGPPDGIVRFAEGRFGTFAADLSRIEGCGAVADAGEAEACLTSPAVESAVALLATLELHDVPWDAMP